MSVAEDLIRSAATAQRTALSRTAALRAELPLRYLHQQVHLTAPANDRPLAEKAAFDAFGVARRALGRYGIGAEDLAERLGLDVAAVEQVVGTPGTAPLVMLDLEDGVPPDLVAEARAEAARLFRTPGWPDTLRFFRPSAIAQERCARDLVEVLVGAGEGLPPEHYPIDGIVFPKLEHAHEVEWLYGVLDGVEAALGLPPHRIRVSYLIERGWALDHLGELAAAGRDRLAAIILGTVDLAADVGLPTVRFRHPLCEWARSVMVAVAGGAGVPAIDGMTIDFPVGRPDLSPEQNRAHVLDRITANFEDTLHSIDLGLAGRWVGHPLQLVASLLAFRAAFPASMLEAELAKVEQFAATLREGKGAVAGSTGELLDIGTDTQVRSLLRRATAWGLVDARRSVALGIVAEDELA
jgi:citrate lyase subunit beta / citryl-CoA lyase